MTTIPNLLTLVRLLCLPVVIVLFRAELWGAAAGVFFAAMLTDCVDGWIAKRLNQCTTLGMYLDPVVDKIVLLTLFYELAHAGLIHAAVPHLFLARELLQNGIRAAGALRGVQVGANWMGKTKAALQTALITWGLCAPWLAATVSASAGRVLSGMLHLATWAVVAAAWCFFAVFAWRHRDILGTGGDAR